jgi:hypothetical protein
LINDVLVLKPVLIGEKFQRGGETLDIETNVLK